MIRSTMVLCLAASIGAVSVGNISLAASAFAQSGITLGERPIRRTEVVAFVRKQFAEMDSNHDGQVSPAEAQAYRARQPAGEQTGLGHIGGHWFEKTDADGNGRVSLQEAIDRPLRLFDMADMNHDGVASVEEQSMAQLFLK
jgi:hypothetical protein